LQNNQLTGAGPGICSIVANITYFNFGSNPAWTEPAQCPACLNTLAGVPVICTGANSVAPTAAPTAVASSAVTIGASVAAAALVVASLAAMGP
jgi:hypothetical protein